MTFTDVAQLASKRRTQRAQLPVRRARRVPKGVLRNQLRKIHAARHPALERHEFERSCDQLSEPDSTTFVAPVARTALSICWKPAFFHVRFTSAEAVANCVSVPVPLRSSACGGLLSDVDASPMNGSLNSSKITAGLPLNVLASGVQKGQRVISVSHSVLSFRTRGLAVRVRRRPMQVEDHVQAGGVRIRDGLLHRRPIVATRVGVDHLAGLVLRCADRAVTANVHAL